MEKKVQFTRPVLNVPISRIKELPDCTYFTLIGINMKDRPPAEKMFMKKIIRKYDFFNFLPDRPSLKPSQFPVATNSYKGGFLPEVITSLCIFIHNS